MKFIVALFSFVFVSVFLSLKIPALATSPVVVGHRGAMGHVTENTLASVQKAMDLGVDAVEIDVFKIRSGETVVFHDHTLERLTDAEGNIEDWDYSRLSHVTVQGGYRIPKLQDVMDLVNRKVKLNIELKGLGTTGGVNDILNHYTRHKGWTAGDFVISSFNWGELRAMRALNPYVPIALLTSENPLDAIPAAHELRAYAIYASLESLTPEIFGKLKSEGFQVYVWTIDDPGTISNLKEFGVDGIITNFPERVR